MSDVIPVSREAIVSRGFKRLCPNCGGRTLFAGAIRPAATCSACGLSFIKGGGFTMGAMVINYGFLVFGILPIVAVLYFKGLLPETFALLIGCGVALIGPLICYRLAWSLWLMVYYLFLPHELPLNYTSAIPVGKDE